MSFEKYYFAEDNAGATATDTWQAAFDFDSKAPDHVLKMKHSGSNVSDSSEDEDDPNPPVPPVPPVPPKPKPKELPLTRDSGAFGYMVADGHKLFDELVNGIVNNPDKNIKDNIVKANKSKIKGMDAYRILFKPMSDEKNKYLRTMYVLKNNSDGSGDDWTSVAFRTKDSFIDAIKLFFKDMVKNDEELTHALKYTKWHQLAPSKVHDPKIYANWLHNETPQEDIEFTQKILHDVKKESKSFDDFYIYETLLIEDTWLDRKIKDTTKGLTGGIKKMVFNKGGVKNISVNKLAKLFPTNTTYKVNENVYNAMNAICKESYIQWEEVKRELGKIAQMFVKTRSIYVDNITNARVKQPNPKNTEAVDEFDAKMVQQFKDLDLDPEKYNIRIEDIIIYHTTNNGLISTLMITLEKENNNEENPPVGEAVDMTGPSNKLEYMYFIGVNRSGFKFFTNTLGTDIKHFIQVNNTRNGVEKTLSVMNDAYDKVQNEFIGEKYKKRVKRDDIPNDEFNKILHDFSEYIKTAKNTKNNPILKDLKSYKKDGLNITEITLTNGGKVMFVNNEEGAPGRIIMTSRATPYFAKSKVDDVDKNYKEV